MHNISELMNVKIDEIAKVLEENYREEENIGILSGTSGISLFFFYYAQFKKKDDYTYLGTEIIQNAIEKVEKGYGLPTYSSGITGLAWTIEFLNENRFLSVNTDSILADLDNYLYSIMISNINKGNFDFLHGALGYAFYFLKRYNNTNSLKLKDLYKNNILEFIDLLKKVSIKDKYGIKWLSDLDYKEGIKGFNLSLSHGVSSIINFLSRLYKFDDFKTLINPLLLDSINFILNSKNRKIEISLFPNRVIDNGNDENSRLAWCYGDLGIGITLFQASKVLKDKKLEQNSIQILKHSGKRKEVHETMVRDAAICHGAYGMAQIYRRIYWETKEIEFNDAANFWIIEGGRMAVHKDGYAGYKQWLGKKITWASKTGLLEGIAGIGLTMISAISNTEPKWDECLLLS